MLHSTLRMLTGRITDWLIEMKLRFDIDTKHFNSV